MKTNVSIELSDKQRDYLATLIDNKTTKFLDGKDPSYIRG